MRNIFKERREVAPTRKEEIKFAKKESKESSGLPNVEEGKEIVVPVETREPSSNLKRNQ